MVNGGKQGGEVGQGRTEEGRRVPVVVRKANFSKRCLSFPAAHGSASCLASPGSDSLYFVLGSLDNFCAHPRRKRCLESIQEPRARTRRRRSATLGLQLRQCLRGSFLWSHLLSRAGPSRPENVRDDEEKPKDISNRPPSHFATSFCPSIRTKRLL